ncbi:MAG: SDR family NAD(P)-dependent oxidoreductase [Phycisphaerae bacterium]|nr:SDR family NAD(P)-dependent oxidoreductase [Phycisphaerae bacterium]
MPISLTDKPIVITGASSGIGLATAFECARAGMPVVLAARREDRLRDAVDRIRSQGGRAVSIVCDVADPEASAKMIDVCLSSFGSIYSVFANAGYGIEKPVHEMPDADVRAMFEVNFFGTLNTIRPALPHMIRAGAGHVLVCSSCLAKFSIPYFSIYSATKAAQNHISRAMNLELRAKGIRVSSVHPIGTSTEFFQTAQRLSGDQAILEHTPAFFTQSPEKVAKAVVKCLRSPRPEVWTSTFVRVGMALSGLVPRIADRAVHRMVRDYDRRAASNEAASVGAR